MQDTVEQAEVTLLEALNQFFLRAGFADLTVADMARALRCSKRALYQLAKSKAELVSKVVEYNYNKRLSESKAAVFQYSEPVDRLDAYFTLIHQRHNLRVGPFFADVIADPALNQIRLRYVRLQLELLEMTIADGMKRGTFRVQDPPLTTEFSLGIFSTISQPNITVALQTDYGVLFDQAVDILLKGIWSDGDTTLQSTVPPKLEQRGPESESIIDRLEALFEREGFAHFTMSDLTRRLGCSKRALYEVARSKEDLLKLITQRNYERYYDNTRTAVFGEDSPGARLAAFFAVIHNRNQRRAHKFLADVIKTPGPDQIRQLHVRHMLSLLENIIRDGISQGVFRKVNPALTSAIAFGILNGVERAFPERSPDMNYAEVFNRAVNLFQHGILQPAQA